MFIMPTPSRSFSFSKSAIDRRSFLQALTFGGVVLSDLRPAEAALPKTKITRVRFYSPPVLNPLFNQSNIVVTIETDGGIIGVGEGGSKDTLEQCAGRLIGRNPFDIERCWQDMYRAFFYPPGREKIHALGALDLALWDIKGKALGVPVYDLLGGMARNYCELYATGGGPAWPGSAGSKIKDRARAVMAAGYRAYRMDSGAVRGSDIYNTHDRVRQLARDCKEAREGVVNGDWMVDFHTRLDLSDAMRACKLIEEYEPYFVEDPVRDDQFLDDIPKLRKMTTVPIAAGEQWGRIHDFHKLVEAHDIDYVRATVPNVGGITGMQKVAALCETHAVGIAPHFTGPISTAALVHVLGPFPGPLIIEIGGNIQPHAHLPECLNLKDGKLWPNGRPGLGVALDMDKIKQIGEVTEAITNRTTYRRPDGSQTNW
jgi:galactonate dehydratase